MRQVNAVEARPRIGALLAAFGLIAACLPLGLGLSTESAQAAGTLTLTVTNTVITSGDEVAPGTAFTYTYALANGTGKALSSVVVTDTVAGSSVDCHSTTTIAIGGSLSCTASRTVTQADIDAGELLNRIEVSAEDSDGAPVTASADWDLTLLQSATFNLTGSSSLVDTNTSGRNDAGDQLTFTFVAENTGNVTLTTVAVTHTLTTGWTDSVSGECATLAPGDSCTLETSKLLTQADVDTGSISDSASVSGNYNNGTASDTVGPITATITRVSTATVLKTAGVVVDTNSNSIRDAGDVANFSILATNTGNTTLTLASITDTAAGTSKNCGTMAPGATCTVSAAATLTQADVDAGSLDNTATFAATGHGAAAVSTSSTATVTIDPHPDLTITTTAAAYTDADSDGLPDAGEVVPISVVVLNTGNITLASVTVTSDHLSGETTCTSLAPMATCTHSGSYTLLQADIDSGVLAVSGSVDEDTHGTTLDRSDSAPSLTLTQAAKASVDTTTDAPTDGVIAVGASYSFTVTVTNTGNTVLTNVAVTDSLTGGVAGGTTPCATLNPGATCTLTRSHTVTQADVDAGEFADTGSVTATTLDGISLTTSGTPTKTVSINRTATVSVATTSSATDTNTNGRVDAGETVTFTVTATNTGNTTLPTVTVSDSLTGGTTGGTTPCSNLAPLGTCTFTRTHAITQTEINLGSIDDTGSVTATAQTGLTGPTASDLETFSIARTAVFTIATTHTAYVDSNTNSRIDAGEVITFTVTATNSGNTTLSAATVSDSLSGGTTGGTSPCTSVAPGSTCTFTRAYPVTQDDINAGSVTDTGSATATPPAGLTLTAVADDETVTLTRSSDMSITKTTTGIVDTNSSGTQNAGDRVPYVVTATNTGNTTVTSVLVTDELTSATQTCASVAPGGTCVLNTDYYLTQTDVNTGSRSNRATVAATAPDSSISKNVTTSTTITQVNSLSLTNVSNGIVDANNNGKDDKNDTVTFTLTATNTGNTTLTSVTITSPLTSTTNSCGTMLPGATCVYTTPAYKLTQTDIDTGSISNAGSVAGTAPSGSAGGVTASQTATVTLTASYTLSLTKTTPGVTDANSNGRVDAGEIITYTVVAENIGAARFNSVDISDTQTASTKACGAVSVGATCTWTFNYTVTQADINAGSVSGTASATGAGRGSGGATATATDTLTIARTASLSLNTTSGGVTEFVGAGRDDAGDKVTFTVTVTNTGNTTLTSMTVTDTIGAGSTACASLAPGATCVLTTTHTLTQAEVDAGSISDTGSVTATPQAGLTLTTTGTATATQTITRTATASVVTTAATFVDSDTDGYADAGETIAFTVTVTNTGNTTLTSMTVADTLTDGTPGGTSPCASVAPGGTCTRTRTHTLTQAEIDAGSVANTGSVTATVAAGLTLSTSGTPTRTVTIVRSSSATLTNVAGSLTDAALPAGASPGDTISYTITATNTGTTTLTSVTVADGVTAGTQVCATLAPGATCVVSSTYTLVQADVDAGKVDNTATLAYTGHAAPGSASALATVNVPRTNTLSFTNTVAAVVDANSSLRTDAGDTVTYTLAMQNTGNTTLTSVSMYSPKNTFTKSCGTVAPGATCSGTTTYTILQADLNAGTISNTGTIAATSPGGALSGSDTATTVLPRSSTITLGTAVGSVVDANTDASQSAGDTVTFTVTATNTGTTTLTQVVVSDALTADSRTCASVTPAATCVLTTTYTLLQADLDLGQVASDSTVSGTGHQGTVSALSSGTRTMTRLAAVSMTLTAGAITDTNGTPAADAGDTLTFTATARNTGNTTLRSVVVTDTLTSGVKRCATLVPNATCVLTATHTLELADVDAGSVANSAAVAASAFDGARSGSSDLTVTMPQASSMSLATSAGSPADSNLSGRVDAGDSITFTVVATNDGNSTLTSVAVGSDLTGASTTCARLLPGEVCTLNTTHTITQAELDAGSLTHNGHTSGTAPDGATSDTDSITATISRISSVAVSTTVGSITDTNSSGRHDAGDRVTFTVTATNSGTTTLTSMVVSDSLTDPAPATTGGTTPCASVRPAGTCTFTRTHTLTQTEVNAGIVTDLGAASATGHAGTVSNSGSRSANITRVSSLSVATTASPLVDVDTNGDDVGDTLTFTVTVTNSGNTTLTSMTASDSLAGGTTGGTAPCASVAPASTCTFTRTHALTQAEVNSGGVTDTGSATATGHAGSVNGSSARTVSITRLSRLSVSTTAAGIVDANLTGRDDAGDTVAFTVTATNTGNTTLTAVTVSLALTGGSQLCATLAPGATCVLLSTHTVLQTEATAGSVVATGSVSGTGHAVSVSSTGLLSVTLGRVSSIAIDQVAGSIADHNSSTRTDAGDTIVYTVTATNTGTTTLTNVRIADELTEATEVCAAVVPGGTCVLITGHTLAQSDLDLGRIDNDASVEASGHNGILVATDTVSVPVTQASSVTIVNQGGAVVDANSSLRVDAGDTVGFGILATNTGTTTLRDAVIDDPLTGQSKTCPPMAPGAKCVLLARYVLQLADINAGEFINSATVGATGHAGSISATADARVVLVRTASISASSAFVELVDSDGDGVADAGEVARFRLTALNNGNTSLANVTVSDPDHGATRTCAVVAPDDTCELISDVPISQFDVDTGQVGSTASVIGTPANGSDVADEFATIESLPTSELIDVVIAETGRTDADLDGILEVGDRLTVRGIATNTGSRTLRNVVLTESVTRQTSPCSVLAPGATCVLTLEYVVTSPDVSLGYIDADVAVVALGPENSVADAAGSLITRLDPATPSLVLTVTKTAHTDRDSSSSVTRGDELEYTLSARNLSATPATAVRVTSLLTGEQQECATLASGATCTLVVHHDVTSAEAGAGVVVSTATVISDQVSLQSVTVRVDVDGGERVTISAEFIELDTTLVGPDERVDAGDAGSWEYTITNTGDVTLTGLEFSGSFADEVVCPTGALLSLAAAGTIVCTLDLSITQAAIDDEEIDVSLTVDTSGSATDTSILVTPLEPDAAVSLVKTVLGHSAACDDTSALPVVGIGGTARWCFAMTNTGNRTLQSLLVTDSAIGISDLASQPSGIPASLAPGATVVVSTTRTHDTSLTNSAIVSADVTGETSGIATVNSDESTATLTVAPVQPVSGIVWLDLDLDGERDEVEPLLPDVSIELAAEDDPTVVLAEIATDTAGSYSFEEVLVGSYRVTAQQGVRGVAAHTDSDGGSDWVVAVAVSGTPVTADFAGRGMATIQGRVLHATAEVALADVAVSCSWIGFDGRLMSADDVVFTATTGVDGRYSIQRLPYGDVQCTFTAPGFADPEHFIVTLTAPTTPIGDIAFGRQTPLVGNDPRPATELALGLLLVGSGLVAIVGRRPRRAAS